MRSAGVLEVDMFKERLIYPLILAVVLALFFVAGNRPHSVSVFRGILPFLAFPVVLTIQLWSAVRRNPSLSFGHAFRLGESTAGLAAFFYPAMTLPFLYFYFSKAGGVVVAMSLLVIIIGTYLVGTLFSLLCAFAIVRTAGKHQSA